VKLNKNIDFKKALNAHAIIEEEIDNGERREEHVKRK
jgi:hypothetical protein